MTTKRFLIVSCAALLLLCCVPAHAKTVVLEPDRVLQARVRSAFGRTQGTVIVYDMRAHRVLAVTDATIAFRTLRPPGSLMKLVTAVALLERDLLAPGERVECTNHLEVAGRTFTCAIPGGHGAMDLGRAIAKSCSIYFYAKGQRLLAAQLLQAATQLGIGDPSPFAAGLSSRLSRPRSQRDLTLALVGEGSSVRITPWDAVVMVSRLHDGTHGAERYVFDRMRDVVTQGTGQSAAVAGLAVHGKTGTATWLGRTRPDSPPRTHGWFAGTAGRLAVVVFLESGTGRDAAAMAGRVLRACKERT